MEELPEHLIHEILEYGGSVDQAIWHDAIFFVPSKCHKSGLPFVSLKNLDEVEGTLEVQLEDGTLGQEKVDNIISL